MSTSTATQQLAPHSALRRLVARHPLVAFWVLLYAGAWLVYLPLVLSQDGIGLLPFSMPFPVLLFNLPASLAGPTLAAFILTAVTSGKPGVRQLLRRIVQWRVGVQWYLLVFLGPPLVALLGATVWLGVAPLKALIPQWPMIFSAYLTDILLIAILVTLWEETGLMGFALPRLQQMYGALLGSAILGPLWVVMHLPAFFVPAMGVVSGEALTLDSLIFTMLLLALLSIPMRIIMTWLFNNTRGSLIIVTLFHAAYVSTQGQLSRLIPGYNSIHLYLALGVCAVLLIVLTQGRLSYQPNHVSQIADAPLTKD